MGVHVRPAERTPGTLPTSMVHQGVTVVLGYAHVPLLGSFTYLSAFLASGVRVVGEFLCVVLPPAPWMVRQLLSLWLTGRAIERADI